LELSRLSLIAMKFGALGGPTARTPQGASPAAKRARRCRDVIFRNFTAEPQRTQSGQDGIRGHVLGNGRTDAHGFQSVGFLTAREVGKSLLE